MWSATGSLTTARYYHTATLLPNGKELVTGGIGASGYLVSAELYDPTSGAWSATSSLTTARAIHTATLLPNGKVLVAGGYNGGVLNSARLYDPASGAWSATGSLTTARALPHGDVATQRQGAGSGGRRWRQLSYQRGTVRPGKRDVECHRQP